MNTGYRVVFDRFIKKLKNDTEFFNYSNKTESQISDLVEEHLVSLLGRAIDIIYDYGIPDFDFMDRDDVLQYFNGELTRQEIALLSDLMYFEYVSEDLNKLKAYGLVLRTSEINALFSPANDRRTYLELINYIETKTINALINYLSRDRLTWKIKSIYGDT